MSEQERRLREMMQNMPPEVKMRAVEIHLDIQEAIRDENRYRAMTNAALARELINGPWADLPMFSKHSNLLEAVIERLQNSSCVVANVASPVRCSGGCGEVIYLTGDTKNVTWLCSVCTAEGKGEG